MKRTKKEDCKDTIRMILKKLETLLFEVHKSNADIFSLEDAPLYGSVNSFGGMLNREYGYGTSTARDALKEMIDAGEVIKNSEGYYTLSDGSVSQNIVTSLSSQMYATILPTVQSIYIEVPDNMAYVLEKRLNNYVARNDKRFYTIAHNLLLLLDLEIPTDSNIVQKDFCLETLLEKHGIRLRAYDIGKTDIKGYDYDTMQSILAKEAYECYLEEINTKYSTAQIQNRKRKPTNHE